MNVHIAGQLVGRGVFEQTRQRINVAGQTVC